TATPAKRPDGLRREADFGHEHEGLFALAENLLDGAQVQFGFAAAGDAMEEKRAEAASPHRLLQHRPGVELIGGKHQRRRFRSRLGFVFAAAPFKSVVGIFDARELAASKALVDEPLD